MELWTDWGSVEESQRRQVYTLRMDLLESKERAESQSKEARRGGKFAENV